MGGMCSCCPCCKASVIKPLPKSSSSRTAPVTSRVTTAVTSRVTSAVTSRVTTPISSRLPTPPSSRQPTPPFSPIPTPFKPKTPRIPSQPIVREYSPEASFTNLSINKINPLTLIEGYEHEPLVSLEEALRPFYDKIDYLSDYIKEAKTKCRSPSEHGLTRDESAAIYIYTMKWGEGCLYNKLHAAWKSQDRSQMKPWLKFLKLFRIALNQLPDAKGEIWQGASFDKSLKEELNLKPLTMYSAMGSCSSSKRIVEQYLDNHGNQQKIILGFKSIGGKSVAGYTAPNSSDIIVWPGTKLGLSNMEVISESGSVTFHLTGAIAPKPIDKSPIIIQKHFVCRNYYCNNRCGRKHETNHCNGFDLLLHTCHHHCDPIPPCSECHKHMSNLRQCRKCKSRFCEDCCLK